MAPTRSRVLLLLVAILLAGVGARTALLVFAPRHGFFTDHLDFVVWAQWAWQHGPTAAYDLPAGTLINTNLPATLASRPFTTPFISYNECNYPPGSIYLLWASAAVWHTLDARPLTHPIYPRIAAEAQTQLAELSSPVANTLTTRVVFALPALACELLLAWGVARLVRRIRSVPCVQTTLSREGALAAPVNGNSVVPAGGPELLAFALVFLAPPVVLDSAFWGQLDACLAAAGLWALVLLLERRFVLAGLCCGAAAMLKPQAVLFLPALLYTAVVAVAGRPAGWVARHLLALAAAAVVSIALLAAPFMLAGRGAPAQPWRWLQRSYVEPIRSQFPITTLKAFNVWWLDFQAARQSPAALDPAGRVAGIPKDVLGRGAALAALVVAAVLCARRFRTHPAGAATFAALSLLTFFVLPTRVHERYLYYALPFVVAVAAAGSGPALPSSTADRPPRWRQIGWWLVVAGMFLVGTFELTWFAWLASPDHGPHAPAASSAARVWSIALAFVTVASFAYALIFAPPAAQSGHGSREL